MSAPGAPAVGRPFDALHDRNFAIAWGAAIISNSGSTIQSVAVPVVIYEITHRTLWLGVASFCGLLAGMVGTFLAGPFGDRIDRRTLLVRTNLVLFVLTLTLWTAWVTARAPIGVLLAVLAVNGFVNGVSSPVWQAFQPQLVPIHLLPSAVRLNSTNYALARALGPVLGTLLLGHFGAGTCFMVNALSFLAVVSALLVIRPVSSDTMRRRGGADQVRPGSNPFKEFAVGWRYMKARPAMRLAPLWTIGYTGLAAVWMPLAAAVASKHFAHSSKDGGLLMAAYGLGSVLAGVGLGRVRLRRSTTAFLAAILAATGLATTALTHVFAMGLIGYFLLGVGHLANATSLNSAIQVQVDDQYRGRMISIYMQAIFISLGLGSIGLARLIEALGVRDVLALCAVGLLVSAVLRGPRGLRALDDARSDEPGPQDRQQPEDPEQPEPGPARSERDVPPGYARK